MEKIDHRVWAFVVIGLALNIITKGLETWMPVYFLQEQGINLKNLAWLVPLPVIFGGIAAFISGFVMVHLFKKHERWMISIASFDIGFHVWALQVHLISRCCDL